MNHPTLPTGARKRSGAIVVPFVAALLALTSPVAGQQKVVSPHGTLPADLDCSTCHTAEGWSKLKSPLGFDHSRSGFVLSGAHKQAACAQCHLDLRFDGPQIAQNDCGSCHADVHEGRMLRACSECHTTSSFEDVDGELVHARTSFPLTGAHRQVTCEACHTTDVGGAFTPLPTECVACHDSDYRNAKTVDHVVSGYPTDCTRCHTTMAWSDSPTFDHATVSGGFALVGAHARLRCASCHQVPGMQPLFTPSSQDDCVACHQADYDREHTGSGFPTTCISCHNVNSWGDASFDHASTGFPLLGAHSSLSCATCHSASNNLAALPSNADDCVACHQADYDREHGGSSIPTTCADCHTTSSWGGATADHALLSGGFALVGAHATAQCTTCHVVPGYDLRFAKPADQNDCVTCHQQEYDGAHAGSGIPTTCVDCHGASSWSGATVDHAALSGGFALVGAHATAQCTACHVVPGYTLKFTTPSSQNDCVVCHQADYDGVHGGSTIPTTCGDCHTATSWGGATADHLALSGYFPLTGAHASAQCTACHTVPGYGLKFDKPASEDDCVVCHLADYNRAHSGSNTPTTCADCHTTRRFGDDPVAMLEPGFELVGGP